jgi:hypothetical protein
MGIVGYKGLALLNSGNIGGGEFGQFWAPLTGVGDCNTKRDRTIKQLTIKKILFFSFLISFSFLAYLLRSTFSKPRRPHFP